MATVMFTDYLYAVIPGDIQVEVAVDGFMPGDKIDFVKGEAVLSYRKPHAVIGVIYSRSATHATIYIPALGACPFMPEIQEPDVLKSIDGTRLILWFYDDGQISVLEKFSSAAADDLACIQALCKANGSFSKLEDYDIYYG